MSEETLYDKLRSALKAIDDQEVPQEDRVVEFVGTQEQYDKFIESFKDYAERSKD